MLKCLPSVLNYAFEFMVLKYSTALHTNRMNNIKKIQKHVCKCMYANAKERPQLWLPLKISFNSLDWHNQKKINAKEKTFVIALRSFFHPSLVGFNCYGGPSERPFPSPSTQAYHWDSGISLIILDSRCAPKVWEACFSFIFYIPHSNFMLV